MASDGLHRREPLPHDPQAMEGKMTAPDKDQLDRSQQLENIVDQLDEKVADEREAEGVPGKPSDREGQPSRGSGEEPPD
jgi:hypothetical protein